MNKKCIPYLGNDFMYNINTLMFNFFFQILI